jgi:(+)-trans-carveol dehydrogenase
MGRLAGKVAFITGAARGQGRAEAVRFAEEGADIIAVDICRHINGVPFDGATREDLSETVRLVKAAGARIVAREADVRQVDELRAVVEEGRAEFGGVDVVVANAGVISYGHSDALSEDEWQLILDVNLTGVWKTITTALPLLRARGGGSIIITSSAGGLIGGPNLSHYNASKHGVVGLMKTLCNELGPESIRVNCICPGCVASPMLLNDALYKLFCPDLPHPGQTDMAGVARGLHTLPVPWVEPVDVANAALFLASDESRYVTGITMSVDAGEVQKIF